MKILSDKINNFFTQQPLPLTAFQFSSRYVSGIHLSSKDRNVKSHFIFPIEEGVIEPSFHKKNIRNAALLEKRIKEGIARLNFSDHKIVVLVPELSQRVFIFSFDSFPTSLSEREQLIRFRAKKQMPLLPKDSRISFDLISFNGKLKVVATIASASIVQEYEDFFSRLRYKVKVIGIPSLSLLNLLDWQKEKDFVLVDVENEAFSLIAVGDSEISIYRQKPMSAEFADSEGLEQNAENIVQEVMNTVNFIEDKEKRKIASFWMRIGVMNFNEEIFSKLEARLAFPLKKIESALPLKLSMMEKKMLSPLLGQLL